MRSRRNLERKRKEEAPEKSGVGVRRARDGGRGGKESEIGADGCINRKAERSRGRLSIPTGEGEFERSLPPGTQAKGILSADGTRWVSENENVARCSQRGEHEHGMVQRITLHSG